jgi:hypothetical protein
MIGNAGTPPVRWAVMIVLGLATAGMVAVSMRANYLFGHGFGQSPEKAQVFGWANVAADLWKVSGLILIGGLWRAQRKRLAVVLFPVWLLCLLWGLTGAIGVYAQDRTALIGGREDAALAHAEAEHELADIERTIARLTPRTLAQVDAAIAAVLARPVRTGDRLRGTVGSISANCRREDRRTADACLEVARLREERAAAHEASRLRDRADELRAALAPLRERGAAQPADPAAELFAWLSGGQLRVHDIAFGFPLVFALLIELISAFGPAAIAAFADATHSMGKGSTATTEPAAARHGELRPAAAGSGAPRLVAHWMSERTEPTGGGPAISIEQLHADFAAWCDAHGIAEHGLTVFQSGFDHVRDAREVRGSIRKFGNRYYGIRIAGGVRLLRKP